MKNLFNKIVRVIKDVKENGYNSKYVSTDTLYDEDNDKDTFHHINFYEILCEWSWESFDNNVNEDFARYIQNKTFIYGENNFYLYYSGINTFKKYYHTDTIYGEEIGGYSNLMVYIYSLLNRFYFYENHHINTNDDIYDAVSSLF